MKNSSFLNMIDWKAIEVPLTIRTVITLKYMLLLIKNKKKLSTHAPNNCKLMIICIALHIAMCLWQVHIHI